MGTSPHKILIKFYGDLRLLIVLIVFIVLIVLFVLIVLIVFIVLIVLFVFIVLIVFVSVRLGSFFLLWSLVFICVDCAYCGY